MLIDFHYEQQKKFDALVSEILQRPKAYLHFDSIHDFYQADWLRRFPKGTVWSVTGLDDGAEEYCICIEYKAHRLFIDYAETQCSLMYETLGVKQHYQF